MNQQSVTFDERYRIGRKLVDELGPAQDTEPSTFELLGLEWDLVPGTYAPKPGTGTEYYTTAIPYPQGGSFLEIGCGAGVTAVWAALHGCAHVTATDVTVTAVASAELNVERHGVADRVHVQRSDVFADLDPDAKFDAIFWNCSVIEAPKDFEFTQDFEWAIFDPGYAALGRYLAEVHDRLLPGGRALVTFNSLGDASRVAELADEKGVTLSLVDSSTRVLAGEEVTYKVFEITRP
ncbi:methyltransferase [Actinokineospora diospyrosa]|uniref:Methyltransferase small domain-containing protein n=1 Tax=Actinokineospora diospyrosa TaxID=103728 RepID=A0ABT1I979_9PSEU|nr:methyltransferase [Actinokineospora diospyrosa]MCP2269180.1 Methyltransferase small domain-containing protein [Actinokineospora diospyrosa]